MPFGLLLFIPNDNSLIHSEYDCDLIFTLVRRRVDLKLHLVNDLDLHLVDDFCLFSKFRLVYLNVMF